MNRTVNEYIKDLCGSGMPGGGGIAGVVAAAAPALCSMVGRLTVSRSQEPDHIRELVAKTDVLAARMLELAKADESAFTPLGEAMSMPKDHPDRPAKWKAGVESALGVPMALLREIAAVFEPLEELADVGYAYAISDIGVAASACRCALDSTILNVTINASFIKDPQERRQVMDEATALVEQGVARCEAVYAKIKKRVSA